MSKCGAAAIINEELESKIVRHKWKATGQTKKNIESRGSHTNFSQQVLLYGKCILRGAGHEVGLRRNTEA
jgi:hypothetical protein